ncbi:MAG: 4'-phosphopantetheinyl transferase superfamily protein [Aquisalinus sp.]|nr:4'-phosphopantetheinyl transferase superfamily protein [Aquisalinus sp.]
MDIELADWSATDFATIKKVSVLAPDTTDLWLLDLTGKGQNISRLKKLLDEPEKARAQKYRFREHRHRFILRRAFQRIVLAAYADAEPDQLVYGLDHPEKPMLADYPDLQFSAANSGQTGLLSVSRSPVGIDLEASAEQPALKLVARDNFTRFEQQRLAGLSGKEWLAGFTKLWTQKEAILKLLGTGLSMSPLELTVAINEATATWTDTERGVDQWHIQTFKTHNQLIATIASTYRPGHLRYFGLCGSA